MTQAAILGEACGRVVWIARAVEICQMARYTPHREPGERIVYVTLGTRCNTDMSTCQGKRRIAMVERCAWPAGRSVTQATVLRETGGLVAGILGINGTHEVA